MKQHVVAPADVLGVGGRYELVNNETMVTVHNLTDAADWIRYLGDEEREPDHGEALSAT